jgi:bifunctional non-homologous end joining protein LigD
MQPTREHSRARLITHGKARPSSRLDLLSSLPDATPAFVPPMMAKPVSSLPVGQQWRYELKLDGYRALAIKAAAGVKLIA